MAGAAVVVTSIFGRSRRQRGHGDRSPQLPALVATHHPWCGSHGAQALLWGCVWLEGWCWHPGVPCQVIFGGGREAAMPAGLVVMPGSSTIPGLQIWLCRATRVQGGQSLVDVWVLLLPLPLNTGVMVPPSLPALGGAARDAEGSAGIPHVPGGCCAVTAVM